MKFKYEGFNVGGQVTSGEVEATSREEAAENLREAGLYVQQLKEVGVEEFKPVLPQKQKADDFTEGLGFKPLKPKEEPKQEAPKEEKTWLPEKDVEETPKVVEEVAQKMEDTQEIVRKEVGCPEGCQCEHTCSDPLQRDVDDVLMTDITHLMAAGTDSQMLMKVMYKDNPGMYDIMKDLVQSGMAHALGQLLVESVARRRKPN